ncbi:MAG: hypothetical protein RL531_503 [Actinomycetota bacterium]
MRRGLRGGTNRPGSARPGMGFGRPLRARPPIVGSERRWPESTWWAEPVEAAEEEQVVGPMTPKRV